MCNYLISNSINRILHATTDDHILTNDAIPYICIPLFFWPGNIIRWLSVVIQLSFCPGLFCALHFRK